MKILQVATFLDPQFKCPFSNDLDVADIKDTLQEESPSMWCCDCSAFSIRRFIKLYSCCRCFTCQEAQSWFLLQGSYRSTSASSITGAADESRITCIQSHAKVGPWWGFTILVESAKSQVSDLRKLAQSYLSVCVTSSPSERLFSTSGNIVTTQRDSLKPDKVNMLVFLTKNL